MTQTNDFTTTDGGATMPETIKVHGESLVAKVKELIHQGNVTRIVVENGDGDPVFEVPVNAGVIALVIAPVLTAVGAVALLASDWTLEVYREGEADRLSATQETAAAAPVIDAAE